MDKQKLLDDFVQLWSNLPPQRTPQWYADRTFSIGASEMATIFDDKLNPYQNTRQLVEKHCGLGPEMVMKAMNWGNVLEEVVTLFTAIIFNCIVVEMGSIPTDGCEYQRCSPDGVGLVKILGNLIASFEFKAPLNRIPKEGVVPPYYKTQVLAQLCAIVPSDIGIFVDVVLRRCSSEQWTFSSLGYDTEYHRKTPFDKVVSKTMLYFYRTEPDDTETEPVNLGECSGEEFDAMLASVAQEKTNRCVYGKVLVSSGPDKDIEEELKENMEPGCVGYLPLKMMDVVIVPVQKEPDFVKKFQPRINEIINIVKRVMDLPEEERRDACTKECDAHGYPMPKPKKKWVPRNP